ncbi:hypothetical protein BCR43DRAFT_264123 [Syncephalastrum racemosum]|uniref:Uncharacterized protein n=1 Tax=Syncephalastrum racemosum TaxID=13706 RepID=A0A1X2HH44_SYNRA|nr:hypothetical protein BCR43DRAFT_264123 [Syncephalastrum racemosum]
MRKASRQCFRSVSIPRHRNRTYPSYVLPSGPGCLSFLLGNISLGKILKVHHWI